jgi:sigma-B regulation protein RsbU (phosphoserine phosphatase)
MNVGLWLCDDVPSPSKGDFSDYAKCLADRFGLGSVDDLLIWNVYQNENLSSANLCDVCIVEDFTSGRLMCRDIIHPEDFKRIKREIEQFSKVGQLSYTQYYRIITQSAEERWVEDRTTVITDSVSGKSHYQGIVIDIHRRKVAEKALRKSEEKYRQIVENAGEGFVLMNKEFQILDVNQTYAHMVQKSRGDLIGDNLSVIDCDSYYQFWEACREQVSAQQKFECVLLSGSGKKIPVLIHASVLYSDQGYVIGNMAFVTNLTQHKRALELAGEVQRRLLPETSPNVEGIDIAGRNRQCDEVGGDYYDFLENGYDKSFSVVVGDIAGHGVDSALLMASSRTFLRMKVLQPGSPGDIITSLNKNFSTDVQDSGTFQTVFFLTFSPDRSRVDWVRAGHDPAFFFDSTKGQFEELTGVGIALGLDPTCKFPVQTKDNLKPGDIIILGTDGVWEGRNAKGEMFGKQRLKAVIQKNAIKDANVILDKVFLAHQEFTTRTVQEDDITLVIAKIYK